MRKRFEDRQRKLGRDPQPTPQTPEQASATTAPAASPAALPLPAAAATPPPPPTVTIDSLAADWGALYPQIISQARAEGWTPGDTARIILEAAEVTRARERVYSGAELTAQIAKAKAGGRMIGPAQAHGELLSIVLNQPGARLRDYIDGQAVQGRKVDVLTADREMHAQGLQ